MKQNYLNLWIKANGFVLSPYRYFFFNIYFRKRISFFFLMFLFYTCCHRIQNVWEIFQVFKFVNDWMTISVVVDSRNFRLFDELLKVIFISLVFRKGKIQFIYFYRVSINDDVVHFIKRIIVSVIFGIWHIGLSSKMRSRSPHSSYRIWGFSGKNAQFIRVFVRRLFNYSIAFICSLLSTLHQKSEIITFSTLGPFLVFRNSCCLQIPCTRII